MAEELNYSIYREKRADGHIIGHLPLSLIKEIHGDGIKMICKPRNGEKPFVIVK